MIRGVARLNPEMKLHMPVAFLLAISLSTRSNADTSSTTTTICLQSIASNTNPLIPLAEIQYDPLPLSAEFVTFNAPDISSEISLIRIGTCDALSQQWISSTSVTSSESFSQGYAPFIVLSLDVHGDIIGVTCKSYKVDAGHTRNFGPKLKVVEMTKGKKPQLNQPIVISKEGTEEGELPEKTIFQKYWWVAAGVMLLLLASGGGDS